MNKMPRYILIIGASNLSCLYLVDVRRHTLGTNSVAPYVDFHTNSKSVSSFLGLTLTMISSAGMRKLVAMCSLGTGFSQVPLSGSESNLGTTISNTLIVEFIANCFPGQMAFPPPKTR